MTPVLLTFGGVLLFIMAAYWLFVMRPETVVQGRIRKRLRRGQHVVDEAKSSVSRSAQQLSSIPALNAVLSRGPSLPQHLQALLARAGLTQTVGTVVLLSAFLVVAVFELLVFLHVNWAIAAILAASAGTGPYLFIRYKAEKRMQRFEELFPEAIGLIIRSLRAGHAFTTGLSMVAEEMDPPVGPEFKLLYDEQNFGMPLGEALKRLTMRVPLLDVKFFVTAVLTQREAGGNLAEVLENLTAVVRDRFKVKRQVRVVTAHARITGTILMVLPVVCALIMLVIAPAQMRILWTDAIGIRMLITAVVLQVLGVLIIRRLIRIDY